MAIYELLNYNRAALTKPIIPVGTDPTLFLEFGLYVPQASNFVELIATFCWNATLEGNINSPRIFIEITQDDVPIDLNIAQDSSTGFDDTLTLNVTTFQQILTDVPTGHHVYKLYARNLQPAEGSIIAVNLVNLSGKVIGPTTS
ncbi:hypothetical protein [Paenibacillus sp. Z3-2]